MKSETPNGSAPTEPKTAAATPVSSISEAPVASSPRSPAAEPSSSHCIRSPRGKIARLPKAIRDKINNMLRDGVAQPEIISRLGDELKGITARNVSHWYTSPSYQHWLLQQEWFESLRTKQEPAFDLVNDFDAAKFNEGALQLAASRLFISMQDLEGGDLNQNLAAMPEPSVPWSTLSLGLPAKAPASRNTATPARRPSLPNSNEWIQTANLPRRKKICSLIKWIRSSKSAAAPKLLLPLPLTQRVAAQNQRGLLPLLPSCGRKSR